MNRLSAYLDDINAESGRLERTWEQVRSQWRDQVAAEFEQHDWLPLESQLHDYLAALSTLIEGIDKAGREADVAV
jgi:hypothetical protein